MNSKELTELIQKNTRVILPEFGAFLVKEGGEAGFNPSNVSFSPFLRYNDGMLEVYVAKSKGISKEEAAKEVHEFVDLVKNELQEKGFFQIETLGQLKKDSRGSLTFALAEVAQNNVKTDKRLSTQPSEPEVKPKSVDEEKKDLWEEESKPIAPSEPPAKIKRAAKAKVEKLTTSKKTSIASPTQEPQSQKLPEVEVKPNITPSQDFENEPKVEELVEPKQTIIVEPIKIDVNEVKEVINVKAPNDLINKETKSNTETDSKKEEKKTSKKGHRYVFIGATILIAIALVFIIRFYYLAPDVESINDNLKSIQVPENTVKENDKTQDNIEKPKDDIDKAFNEATNEPKEKQLSKEEQHKKELVQEEAIKKAVIQNAQIKIEPKVKFYIIAGSFKNQDLAEKFSNNLKKSGYNTIIVVQPSGMNAVSLGSYSTRDEANEASKSFKKKFPNSWILKK